MQKHLCVLIHIRIKLKLVLKHTSAHQYFYRPFQGGASYVDPFCYFCFMFVFVILSSLFFAALLSPAGESTGLLALVLVVFSCDVVTFPNGESSHVGT